MEPRDVLLDTFGRIREAVHEAVEGLSREELAHRPGGQGNSIAWLVWHLVRIQDDHVADVAGRPQVWPEGWSQRFALPFGDEDTGYGHTSADVAAVVADADVLLGYADAVADRTEEFLTGLSADDLERVVDTRWDPPVTLAVRLVSVVSDDLQHAGQAAYVRGLLPPR